MPTYQYRCQEQGHEFDAVQSFSDDALTECEVCNGPVKKVFSGVGISFKGDGFYKNDHGANAKGKSSTASTSSDSGSSSSSTSSSVDSSSGSKDAASSTSSTSTASSSSSSD